MAITPAKREESQVPGREPRQRAGNADGAESGRWRHRKGVPGSTSASKDTLDFHFSSPLFIYVFNYVYVCMSVCGYVRVCR